MKQSDYLKAGINTLNNHITMENRKENPSQDLLIHYTTRKNTFEEMLGQVESGRFEGETAFVSNKVDEPFIY